MTYLFQPMMRKHAESMMNWRYQEPYDFYNFDNSEEMMSELMNGDYYSVFNDKDIESPIGFFCIGNSARVPAGYTAGIYNRSELMDVGLGLEPSQTGKGLGRIFVKEGMDYLRQLLNQEMFRLVVASFNERAIHVYRENGFVEHSKITSKVHDREVEFICMIREN
ncbi:GNAT family N-acetyltransferase [Paenibacillus terrigena]|uniref:GNAT family N-acetyltransferase n=1 Tax=Paenibacillus terrigena TaxID=369333 RepID=UPI0003695EBA|nr:GNAT family N-acetyltransferase [Paenibacillus terrigena]